MLVGVLDTLALIRLGRTLLANLRGKLADLLLICTTELADGTSIVIPGTSGTIT